jgi:hypothetical protein
MPQASKHTENTGLQKIEIDAAGIKTRRRHRRRQGSASDSHGVSGSCDSDPSSRFVCFSASFGSRSLYLGPFSFRVFRDGMKSVGAPRVVASMSKSGRVCASEPAGACNTRGWPEGNRGSRNTLGLMPVSVSEPVGEKGTFVGVVEPRMPECHLSRPLPPKPGHATGLPHKPTP